MIQRRCFAYILILGMAQGILLPVSILCLHLNKMESAAYAFFLDDFQNSEDFGATGPAEEKSTETQHFYTQASDFRLSFSLFNFPSILLAEDDLMINRLSQKVVVPPPEGFEV